MTTIMGRLLSLTVIWWALTEGDLSGAVFGLVVAIIVTVVSMLLFPPGTVRVHPVPFLLFALFFLGRSVIAGLDVARRLMSPSLPVNPGYLTVRLRLPEGSPRWLLANSLSLMPGTLTIHLKGDRLELHCLDISHSVEQEVKIAEQKVARVFGLSLPRDTRGAKGADNDACI